MADPRHVAAFDPPGPTDRGREHADKVQPGAQKVSSAPWVRACKTPHIDRAGLGWLRSIHAQEAGVVDQPQSRWGWKRGMVAGLIVGTIAGTYIGVMETSFLEAIPAFLGAFFGMMILMTVVGPAQDRLMRGAMRRWSKR